MEGQISREKALSLIKEENRPRYQNIAWYLQAVGLNYHDVIKTINRAESYIEVESKKNLIISKYASTFEVGFETRIATIARNMQKFGNEITIITSDSNHFIKFRKFNKTYNVLNHNQLKIICIKTLNIKKQFLFEEY